MNENKEKLKRMETKLIVPVEQEFVSDELITSEEVEQFAKCMNVDVTEIAVAKKFLRTSSREQLSLYLKRFDHLSDIVSTIQELPLNQLAEIKRIVKNIAFYQEIIETEAMNRPSF